MSPGQLQLTGWNLGSQHTCPTLAKVTRVGFCDTVIPGTEYVDGVITKSRDNDRVTQRNTESGEMGEQGVDAKTRKPETTKC